MSSARGWMPGLLVGAPALPWVWDACQRASWATLGRDQGIFQYVAWAVACGVKAYRDVRDVNGPLVVMLHRVMLALGGADEHRFRVLDLCLVGATAAFVGGCLPWLGERRGAARVVSMAVAAWILVKAQYVLYGFWDTAQRESFFDAFVVVSMGLQLVAQARLRQAPSRGRSGATGTALLLAAAGAASLAPWLGKPTYALVTFGQLAALLADDVATSRRRRCAIFAAGGALGAAVPLAYLAVSGDVRAWLEITFVDVPAMYRFIWPRTAWGVLSLYPEWSALAGATGLAVLALVALGALPRRALSFGTLPLAGLASVVAQAKGFAYHFHPATLGATLALLVLADRAWAFADARPGVLVRAGAIAFALLVGGRAALALRSAPFPPAPPPGARDAASLGSEARLAPFVRVDFFPFALRRAAAYLKDHLGPQERVQMYGMDPYLLFLAERRSATPYIYAYDLDVAAALAGSYEPGGLHPDEPQRARIRAMQRAHEQDLLARIEQAPPGAFVFLGRSPLMVHADAVRDFEESCPMAAAWVLPRYREAARFDDIRVYLRADLADLADRASQ